MTKVRSISAALVFCFVMPVVVTTAFADDPCFKILLADEMCVDEKLKGPPTPSEAGCTDCYEWVVYPTTKKECKNTYEFNGDGKTACDNTGDGWFHPEKVKYQCTGGQCVEWDREDYTAIECPAPAYPISAVDCVAEGTS